VSDNGNPSFEFYKDAFLQEGMIDLGSGAYPIMMDYDNDGLDDLLVGNYGYYDTSYYDQFLILHSEYSGAAGLFRNTGTKEAPVFRFEEKDVSGISAYYGLKGIYPAIADLDGDGDMDMLLGNENGNLIFCRNEASGGQPAEFVPADMNFQDIDVGEYSAPELFDLNGDQLPDLVIGEREGNLNYFRNTGSAETPLFTLMTDSLGKVNVTDPDVSLDGYSTPRIFREAGNRISLIVGSEQGVLFYYPDIQDHMSGTFTRSDSLFLDIADQPVNPDRGYRSAAWVGDLNNDGNLEMIAGNFSGGLEYFGKTAAPPVSQEIGEHVPGKAIVTIRPVPADDHIYIDFSDPGEYASYDLTLLNATGMSVFFRQRLNMAESVIYTGSFTPGIYFYRIILNKNGTGSCKVVTGKIVIIR
jgi:hypothetical protein